MESWWLWGCVVFWLCCFGKVWLVELLMLVGFWLVGLLGLVGFWLLKVG